MVLIILNLLNEYLFCRYERSAEDVRLLIGHAKLDESKLTHITQILNYSSFNEQFDGYKLLQLDTHLTQQLQEGKEIYFKGFFIFNFY